MRVWYVGLPIVVMVLGSAQGCSQDVTDITSAPDTAAVTSDSVLVSDRCGQ